MEGGERSSSCPLKLFLFLNPGRLVMQLEELKHCVLNLAAATASARPRCQAVVAQLNSVHLHLNIKAQKHSSFSRNVSA